jgi:putative PLP-dependent aminotransferase (TIGR04422 family)
MKSVPIWNNVDPINFDITQNCKYIEDFFDKIFYPYKTIYLSKARHFIPIVLRQHHLTRGDTIFTIPYSSHCVLSSIGMQATPITQVDQTVIDASIVFHQYGKKEVVDNLKYPNVILEDSVDSIILDSSENSIFPNNSNYAIISLPKILPVPFGGIMICRNNEDYGDIYDIVQKEKSVSSDFPLKLFLNNHYLREAILSEFKRVSFSVPNFDLLYQRSVEKVRSNCLAVQNLFDIKFDISQRLPSNALTDNFDILLKDIYKEKKIESPIRHIFDYDSNSIHKKVLIPVHSGIDWCEVK